MKNKERQVIIEEFYKIMRKNALGIDLKWFPGGLFTICEVMLCITPFQRIYSERDWWIVSYIIFMGLWSMVLYIMPYQRFKEGEKNVSIYKKLRYIPISKRELQKVQVIHFSKYVAKIFGVALGIQLLASFYDYGSITWQNVLYIVVVTLLIPWIFGIMEIYFVEMEK